ncbi:MAG: M1 family metallopeptidase [Bacteroidetes bacterium]|nr:M1 family metallopeptidase [Bacteroidota bacterium]
MIKRILFVALAQSFFFHFVMAQSLYVPRDVQEAYKNDTRSMDGKPGKNYWQNRGRYNITITAMPPDRNIKGSEMITYINNSPDTLKELVFKLILNNHKPGAIRFGDASEDYLTDGVHIDRFTLDGVSSKWMEGYGHGTWQGQKLRNPLLPHDSVQIAVDWHYTISLQSGREGMLDSTTYFLAYFYPRVAVYDDYRGWDKMNFTGDQEFYNDFNDYTLTVNVPKNFIVWATGTLQNPDEVLQPAYADKLKRSMVSDKTMRIATPEDLAAKNITAQKDINAWIWKAHDISDMALALSDHYVWDAASVIVDGKTQRRASVQAAYNDTAQDYHQMVEYGMHALNWLSNNWPGIPYPYPKTTIVQGFADMEYPMMVNDETFEDPNFAKFVVEHELAHSYMPFYMGINETRYGFMDEGWATTFELLIGRADVGNEMADNLFKQFRVEGWITDNNQEEDLPIITPGNIYSGVGLGNNEYGKASLGYLAMKDLLGDDLFKKCLHAYMDRWHGKHPIPWDFFYTYNDVAARNLNWFWNSWYFSNYYIDMKISSVNKTAKGYAIYIENVGGFPAPFDIKITYADGTINSLHQTPGLWEKNMKTAVVPLSSGKVIQSIKLDGGIFMDATPEDNSWEKP